MKLFFLTLSMLGFIISAASANSIQTLSKGEQPILQQFLTKHGILKAPGVKEGVSPVNAMDYQEVSPYPAHNRVWSFEKRGYVLRTAGKHRR